MRAAIETIASFPEMDKEARDRFIAIIGEEAQRLSERLGPDGRRIRRFVCAPSGRSRTCAARI
jgi:hypothetical protein